MIEDPNSESPSSGNPEGLQSNANTADKFRKPGSTGKGPDMPEDHTSHRTDPEEDYPKPDGSERGGQGAP